MQTRADTQEFPSDDEYIPCCHHCPAIEAQPNNPQWLAGSSNALPTQCTDEETSETAFNAGIQVSGITFPPMDTEVRAPVASLSSSYQFGDSRICYDQVIDVDPQTLRKAERDPNTRLIVYQCKWAEDEKPCYQWIEGSPREIRTHLRIHHGVQGQAKDQTRCRWLPCVEERKIGSIPRHVMTHLRIAFRCSICRAVFAREDCIQAHRREVRGCTEGETDVEPGPGARIVVPQRMSQS